MTGWTSYIGSQSQAGTLTWNTGSTGNNGTGTLSLLAITDSFNSANTQTCNLGYDGLLRVSNVNCGLLWSQAFTYDLYGNISKTGNSNFNPGYGAGNHVTGFGYDNNGNVTSDGINTYSYDVEGRPVTAGGTTVLYDAFNRLVEVQASGGNTEILYGPDGFKFAYMNGASVLRYIAPMVGGTQAVYNGTGVQYYRHMDWLGSSRFASTPSGTMYGDQAYAPFGEGYVSTGTALSDFTGQTQDMTAGFHDFLLRQYSPAEGRWLSPDPAGLAAVDLTNPQTWNRYAYVHNNPLSHIDPKGLYVCSPFDYSGTAVACNAGFVSIGAGGGGGLDWNPCGVYCAPPTSLLANITAQQEAFGDQLQAQFELNAAIDLADFVLNQDDNGCSSWLNGYAADFMPPGLQGDMLQNKAAAMFQSDSFALVNNSAFTTTIANTTQGTGWGSSIYINVNSPWTISSPPPGMPGVGGYYTSGSFSGSDFASTSLYGQTVTVLHEFGHTINALGTDVGPNAQTTSSANTATVARNCGGAITGAK